MQSRDAEQDLRADSSTAVTSKVTLHFLCGKIGAGKSTLAHELAKTPKTILISEDVWLDRLFADEIKDTSDYSRCAGRLRLALSDHIEALLRADLSVVLDLPANTPATLQWLRGLSDRSGVMHQLHFIDLPDDVCKARLRSRNSTGVHPFLISDAQFEEVTCAFVPPTDLEGLNIIRH